MIINMRIYKLSMINSKKTPIPANRNKVYSRCFQKGSTNPLIIAAVSHIRKMEIFTAVPLKSASLYKGLSRTMYLSIVRHSTVRLEASTAKTRITLTAMEYGFNFRFESFSFTQY